MVPFNELSMAVAKVAAPVANAFVEIPYDISHKKFKMKGYQNEVISVSVFEPKNARKNLPALIYAHGGGFGYGAFPHHIKLAALYAKYANCRVFMPHYQLLPDAAFPAAVVDCVKCYNYVLAHKKQFKVDVHHIAVGGDSAGGGIAATLANFMEEISGVRPCGQMLIYPFTDVKMNTSSMEEFIDTPYWCSINNLQMLRYYLAGSAKRNVRFAAPISNPLPDVIADAYIETCEYDCLRDEARDYAKRLREHGGRVFERRIPEALHAYDMFLQKESVRKSVKARIQFLRQVFEMEDYVARTAGYSIPVRHHMKKRVFTGLENLPEGHADGEIIDGCIVLEGGAFRGVYGEGVLDALMENGIAMQTTIGVSAGAMNGLNYVARQIGRSARINLRYRFDQRYVGAKALKDNHGIIGFDFVYNDIDDKDPFDEEAFCDSKRRYVAVATDVDTAQPVYYDRDSCSDIFKAVQASASMPYVSEPVELDGHACLDGGCSVNTPYQWAVDEDYEKIVVIRTRNREYRKGEEALFVRKMNTIMYRNKPLLMENLKNAPARYEAECIELERLEKEGRIFVIAPEEPLNIGRLERDMEKLGDLYYQGYEDGMKALEGLKEYLGI